MLRRGCRCACGTPWSFSQHLSPPGGGSRHHPAACAVAQVLTGEGSSHGRVPWFPVHVWCISAGAILYHSAYAPPEATCEEPEESSQDSKSNSHTAKFTIFCDKARRAAAEVCPGTVSLSCECNNSAIDLESRSLCHGLLQSEKSRYIVAASRHGNLLLVLRSPCCRA